MHVAINIAHNTAGNYSDLQLTVSSVVKPVSMVRFLVSSGRITNLITTLITTSNILSDVC